MNLIARRDTLESTGFHPFFRSNTQAFEVLCTHLTSFDNLAAALPHPNPSPLTQCRTPCCIC